MCIQVCSFHPNECIDNYLLLNFTKELPRVNRTYCIQGKFRPHFIFALFAL